MALYVYHKINDVTHTDVYPLPRINDILDALRGAKYFCSIDFNNGYWQIKVGDQAGEKTAFGSDLGLYEFDCMSFGLTGASATFSRLMDKVLDSLIGKRCLVYLDYVIIYCKTFIETLANLKLVMSHLCEHNQAVHQEILCNNNPSARIVEKVCPLPLQR